MKINKHKIWSALTEVVLRYLKNIKGMFNINAVWHSDFWIPWQLFNGKREISFENFSPALEIQFCRFYRNSRK